MVIKWITKNNNFAKFKNFIIENFFKKSIFNFFIFSMSKFKGIISKTNEKVSLVEEAKQLR